jgi:hypothetical protein
MGGDNTTEGKNPHQLNIYFLIKRQGFCADRVLYLTESDNNKPMLTKETNYMKTLHSAFIFALAFTWTASVQAGVQRFETSIATAFCRTA